MLLPKLEDNTWSTLAIESVLIVLSVVLGFAVTEWRQARENTALAQSAKQNVLSEIERNRAQVAEAQAYHEVLRDSLAHLNDPSAETVARLIREGFVLSNGSRRAGIVSPAHVVSTAWSTAQTTGAIRHLDLEAIQMLSSVYETQGAYRKHRDWFGQSFMSTALQEGAGTFFQHYQNLKLILAQFASQERQLLRTYDRALRRFDRTPPTDSIVVTGVPASDATASGTRP